MWFRGATPAQRAALEKNLVDAYNASQDEYILSVTFNERVDSNIRPRSREASPAGTSPPPIPNASSATHPPRWEPPEEPFTTDVVAVPTRGVERWLAQRLSYHLGAGPDGEPRVCANVTLASPHRLVGAVRAAAAR
ncbi:hypothetical protein [Georgenia muralis]|uniref:Uncharacterized protein n=1 Tax=Georgenia muralis TaxID=154117 RepID=A0A3N5AA70_9MICO|nr:hypothetical protein [Georgenia muralis]RPF28521.1 hypothetical protein EDD32_3049 [Georgenia muralis]